MTEKRFTFDEDVNEDVLYEMGVFSDNGKIMETIDVLTCLNNLVDENEQLKQQKQQYKGQRDYLLFVIERSCSKELFEETKSYLKKVE